MKQTRGPHRPAAWRRQAAKRLLVLLLSGAWEAASAVSCGINVPTLSFGEYDPFSNQALDSASHIAISCDVATNYSIALSPGSGSYTLRAMTSGAHRLDYNLYTDATRTTIWGDGTGITVLVSGNAATANHTVYGRIPPRQNAHVGAYIDAITVTLNY